MSTKDDIEISNQAKIFSRIFLAGIAVIFLYAVFGMGNKLKNQRAYPDNF